MIERGSEVPVSRQAELLDLSRSSVYYAPRPLPARDLMLMRRIDELHLELPFYGSRKLADALQTRGARGRSPARGDPDAPDGHRGDVPQAAHEHPGAGRDDLPVFAGQPGDRATGPGVGERHYVPADGARVPCTWWPSSTSTAARYWRGGSRTR